MIAPRQPFFPRTRWWPFIRLIGTIIMALGWGWGAASLNAQSNTPPTDDEVNKIARQLFCPTCENTPVDVCPTQTCADWRTEIRTQLADGRSEGEILSYFADYYGTQVLANPPREGFGLTAWLTPIVVLLLGGAWFGRYLYQLQQRAEVPQRAMVIGGGDGEATAVAEAEKRYRELIEEEINRP